MTTAELYDELAARPDIETVDVRYRGLLAVVRDTLVAELDLHPWLPGRPVNASLGRGPFARLGGDGEVRRYTSGHSPGAVRDADWPRAVAIVAELVAGHGFTAPPTVVVDRPGDHEVSFAGEYGGELLFGTAVHTTLSLTTGCHLTRDAHLRGPARPPEPPPPAAAPSPPPPPPPRRRRTEIEDEDFDQLDLIRKKKR